MNNILIEVKNLTKKYKQNIVLDNITFAIEKGSRVGFVGDNGAGKTTTVKAILDLINIESGEIYYNGELISSKNSKSRHRIAFFPDLNNIALNMTVLDYAIYVAVSGGLTLKASKAKAIKIAEKLHCEKIMKKKFKELSSGQKKKGLLVSILMNDVDIIILDEPTANLDVTNRFELIEILHSLNKQGITIFITSHIIDELEKFINHLIVISQGKIVYDEKFDNSVDNIKDIYDKYSGIKKTIDLEDLKKL